MAADGREADVARLDWDGWPGNTWVGLGKLPTDLAHAGKSDLPNCQNLLVPNNVNIW